MGCAQPLGVRYSTMRDTVCTTRRFVFFGGEGGVWFTAGRAVRAAQGPWASLFERRLGLELTEPLPIYLLMTGIHESALTTDFKY